MGRAPVVAEGRQRTSGLTAAMTRDGESLARIDLIAAALVARARPTIYRLGTNTADVESAQRLRARAVIEHGWARPDELPDGREEDAGDDRAVHVLAILDGEPIGTCRLIFPEEGWLLPMEQSPGAMRMPSEAVEVGRVVVLHPIARAQRSAVAGLMGAAWLEVRARGFQRICGSVSPPLLRLYRRLGFVLHVVGPPVTTFGEERLPVIFEPDPESAAVAAARHGTSSR